MFSALDLVLTSLSKNRTKNRRTEQKTSPSDDGTLTKKKKKSKRQSTHSQRRDEEDSNSEGDNESVASDRQQQEEDISASDSESSNDSHDNRSDLRKSSSRKSKNNKSTKSSSGRRSDNSSNSKQLDKKTKSRDSSRRRRHSENVLDEENAAAASDPDQQHLAKSMKNMRAYKSEQVLDTSDNDINESSRSASRDISTSSLRQNDTAHKVKQKQLYLELKRKQERARRSMRVIDDVDLHDNKQSGSNNDSTYSLDNQLERKKLAPIVPPKPKTRTTIIAREAVESDNGSSSDSRREKARRNESYLMSTKNPPKLTATATPNKQENKPRCKSDQLSASMPRTKMKEHDEMLNEYFKRAPIDEDLDPSLDMPPSAYTNQAISNSAHKSSTGYDLLNHGTGREVQQSNYHRGGQYSSNRM